MTEILDRVRAHLSAHFAGAEPAVARVTFLGAEPVEVLRFRRGAGELVHYVTLGCSRRPMGDPAEAVTEQVRGPRAEVALCLRDPGPATGIPRSLAILAATPAVEGVVLVPDALIDLGAPLWARDSVSAPFTAILLGRSEIADLELDPPCDPVVFLSATPITATEAAWVRLKGAEAMRRAWHTDGVDVRNPNRAAAQPK
ncbi:suppressor of fused domain protein [Mycobacterium sp. HUMS_1102779]|uniref:suppressor of fused domain protein n=1 Tax=Mycobacterium sp. HUMS_1102779 TaxID=3383487 RepID=UPI00389ACED3